MSTVWHAWRGVVAAVRTRGVVRGPAFATLLATPEPYRPGPTSTASARGADRTTAVAFAALRQLARLPGWRNTCLYRAVAECLVLRAYGMPAVVRLGVVRRDLARDAGPAAAHAWAECPGYRCLAAEGGEAWMYARMYAPLRRAVRYDAPRVAA